MSLIDIATIKEVTSNVQPRPAVLDIDCILGEQFKVLDHGFVRVVDYMGDDAAVVQAARVSYGAGTKTVREDADLIDYLVRHRHTSPLEMCEIKFHVKMPIFVARQWVRHRTASINEVSARYSVLSSEFYMPEAQHIAAQSKDNKQGRGEVVNHVHAEIIQNELQNWHGAASALYKWLLEGEPLSDEKRPGIARELARMVLPLNVYTEWYWKVDLHNLLHFLKLRMDPHAQYEIRAYANEIANLVKCWVPLVWQAFENHELRAVTFSGNVMDALRRCLSSWDRDRLAKELEAAGVGNREAQEVMSALKITNVKG